MVGVLLEETVNDDANEDESSNADADEGDEGAAIGLGHG